MHPVLCQFSSHAVGVHVHNHHHNHIRIGIVVVVIVVIIVVVVIVVVLTVDCRDNGVSGEDCGAHHVQHVERVRPAIGQHVQHDQDPPPSYGETLKNNTLFLLPPLYPKGHFQPL